jgi:hypothetical protein
MTASSCHHSALTLRYRHLNATGTGTVLPAR